MWPDRLSNLGPLAHESDALVGLQGNQTVYMHFLPVNFKFLKANM